MNRKKKKDGPAPQRARLPHLPPAPPLPARPTPKVRQTPQNASRPLQTPQAASRPRQTLDIVAGPLPGRLRADGVLLLRERIPEAGANPAAKSHHPCDVTQSYLKRELNQKLSGNAVYYTACYFLVILKHSYSKVYREKGFTSIFFSYKSRVLMLRNFAGVTGEFTSPQG